MTIFAITTNIQFLAKPIWLDAFFKKHNKAVYGFHVTLKQPCVIQESQIMTIRKILSEYISTKNPKQIEIAFTKLNIDASDAELADGDGCIMIEADSSDISKLQKEIVGVLSAYQDYLNPQTKFYEESFSPHITIASDLNKEEFESAKKDLEEDFQCQAKITEVYLIIVRDFSQKGEGKNKEIIAYKLL